MRYIKTYESFKVTKNNSINEELLGDIFKSAKGAIKNFIGGIMQPFKNLKNDFKKGMKIEEVKNRISKSLDVVLQSAINNINKATNEGEITQMKDLFIKEIDEKMLEFDNEIKSIKESSSTSINEGFVQDGMIRARVMFGILKNEYERIKQDFDKKFAAARDIAAKKQVTITELKTLVSNFKKKIENEDILKQASDKYRTDNQIQPSTENPDIIKSYGVNKKEDLVGKEVKYKTKNFDTSKKAEDQPENIGKLKVLRVTPDGLFLDGEKEDFEKKMSDILPGDMSANNPEETLKIELGKIKTDQNKLKKVSDILPKIIANLDNDVKLNAAIDALS